MISIIMPVRDALDSVKICLGSLFRYTTDFQLILIDDGSKQETREYLESVYNMGKNRHILLIRNDIPQGWCKCINEGVKCAKGEYLVFSNSDIGFTARWAEKLQAHIDNFVENVHIVGPVADHAIGRQKNNYQRKDISLEIVDSLMFFLVMMKRSIWNEVGDLDERFGLGGQDDADYCMRAKQKGLRCGIALDVFVKHHGSQSFRELFDNDAPTSHKYTQSRQKILEEKYNSRIPTDLFMSALDEAQHKTRGDANLVTMDKSIKRPRVFIGIPNRWTVAAELAMLLLRWVMSCKYDLYITMPMGLFPLDNARNTIVKEFRELNYDYLLWIDDDIVPPINALDKLLAADKDIVGAVGFAMKNDNGQYFPYPVTLRYNENKQYILYYGQGVDEVDATGGACILYKRHVYESIERPYEFTYHRDGTLNLTCDFKIFQKAQAAGFKVFVDFSIHCDHQRLCSLKGVQDLVARIQTQSDEYKAEVERLQQELSMLKVGQPMAT